MVNGRGETLHNVSDTHVLHFGLLVLPGLWIQGGVRVNIFDEELETGECILEVPRSPNFRKIIRSDYILRGSIRKRLSHECIEVLCECGSLLERHLRDWVCEGCG